MSQSSEDISQQFINGGVIPGALVGQQAVSKKYVDDQLAIRDTNISTAISAAGNAQATVDNHKTSTTAHPAQNITYSGEATGTNVKQAIDGLDTRIDNLILGNGNSDPEVRDARGEYPVLSDRLNTSDKNINQRCINVKYPPAPLIAAKGDGIANDQSAIQAIIDYANTSGMNVYIPSGTYALGDTLKRKGKVSIYGQGMLSTILKFTKVAGGVVIDTVNEPLHGVTIEGLWLRKDDSVTGGVIGILGGSTIALYNSAIGVFRNLRITGMIDGISGNAVVDGVGIFDCLFDNIFIDNCFNGIRIHGSGNIINHPRIVKCTGAGVSLEYLNGESFAGVTTIGGVFVQNTYDINIPSLNGTRPCVFIGTWFEQSVNGIINVPNAGTRIMNLSFRNCMFQSSSNDALVNFYNVTGAVSIDNCTLIQTLAEDSMSIIAPVDLDSALKVSNTFKLLHNGSRSVVNSAKNTPWIKAALVNTWVDVGPATYTKYWKDDNNVVHLQIACKDGTAAVNTIIATLEAGYRPIQSVRFQVYDITNNKTQNMYVDGTGNLAIGAAGTTGTWAGYISYRADL